MYLFSKKTLGFYPVADKQSYIDAGTLPEDVTEVSDEVRDTYNAQPPAGKILSSDDRGFPAWADRSESDLTADAESLRQSRVDEANAFMNGRQWPGKAALVRLKDDEKEQYGLWLDYLDALYAVDTSKAADITWPEKPADGTVKSSGS